MLLFVVGWPGPRPYIHDHLHFDEDVVAFGGLEQHLIQYHAHAASEVASSELLHFHWLIIPPQAGEPGASCGVKCCSLNELRLDGHNDLNLVNLAQMLCDAPLCILIDVSVELPRPHSSVPCQSVRLHQLYCSMNC